MIGRESGARDEESTCARVVAVGTDQKGPGFRWAMGEMGVDELAPRRFFEARECSQPLIWRSFVSKDQGGVASQEKVDFVYSSENSVYSDAARLNLHPLDCR